jgi:hypothetical protein
MKIAKTWVDTLVRGSVIKNKTSNRIRVILDIELGRELQVRLVNVFNLAIKYDYRYPVVYLERTNLLQHYEKMNLKYRFTVADLQKEKRYYDRHGWEIPDYINNPLKEKEIIDSLY